MWKQSKTHVVPHFFYDTSGEAPLQTLSLTTSCHSFPETARFQKRCFSVTKMTKARDSSVGRIGPGPQPKRRLALLLESFTRLNACLWTP